MKEARKQILREWMKSMKLDIILVYSDIGKYAHHTALGQEKPVLFNYYFITPSDEGVLEPDYLIESKNKVIKKIPIKEQTPDKDLADFINEKYINIGIIGDAPFWHLSKINSKITDLNVRARDLLSIKEKDEIEKIKKSAEEIVRILNIAPSFFIGKNKEDIGSYLVSEILKNNEGVAFPPSIKKIDFKGSKSIVEIDAGVIREGFYSDCTRMYFTNCPEIEKNYLKLIYAHKKAISQLKPGLSINNLIEIYKKEIILEGLPAETLNLDDLGHSIGFYVHEHPIFYLKEDGEIKFKENMIITLEPEIKVGNDKIRVEDMVLIREKPEILTG
jgi:Xaa-Pro aminopeptidase